MDYFRSRAPTGFKSVNPRQTPMKGSSMKTNVLFSTMTMLAGSLIAADSSPKDDIIAAAKKLGGQANYSWKTTVVVPESAQFKPGPTEGQTPADSSVAHRLIIP